MAHRYLPLILVLAAAPAWAQSKRYPPTLDGDPDADAHSRVWDQATVPARAPYDELVHDARALVDQHEHDPLVLAVGKLDKAIALLPDAPEAYVLRGEAALWLARQDGTAWGRCADDLVAADERSHDPGDRLNARLLIGICQSRAGRYADAERTLARIASTATSHRGEVLTRLGEVRIATGKLDEAIDALSAAAEANDFAIPLVHWLLAVAYDRSRRPAEARDELDTAIKADRNFATLESPQYPFLGAGEAEYLKGLSYAASTPPRAEYAVLYFRRYLAAAKDSPWRRRAEEHLREVSGVELPQWLERTSGSTAVVDLDAARAVIKKALPQLRACVAKLPMLAFEVSITRDGPRTPETARDHPRYHVAPEGESSRIALAIDSYTKDQADAAQSCIDPIARRIVLPAPKERDTYYILRFAVVSP